jgi:hypothetical protein
MANIWQTATDGDLDEVQQLVGQDPGLMNGKDDYGRTPLMLACSEGHAEVSRWLVDQGAAINERDDDSETALGCACACDGGSLPVVRLLMEEGADPTIADGQGSTPLMNASEGDHLEIVDLLLEDPSAASTINHRDSMGNTALSLAVCYGNAEMVKVLLKHGADAKTVNNEGETPMAIASTGYYRSPGRRECLVVLEVRLYLPFLPPSPTVPRSQLTEPWWGIVAGCGAGVPYLESWGGGGCGLDPPSARPGSDWGRVGGGALPGEKKSGEGGHPGPCRAVAAARGVPGSCGHDGVTCDGERHHGARRECPAVNGRCSHTESVMNAACVQHKQRCRHC